MSKVWLITGSGNGLGRDIANHPRPGREHAEVPEGTCAAVRESRGLPSGRNGVVEEVVGLFEIAAAAGISERVGSPKPVRKLYYDMTITGIS